MPTDTDKIFRSEILPILTSDALYGQALKRTRNPDDAADVVQRVSMRAWKYRGTYKPGSNAAAWVFTICTNECTAFYNDRRRVDGRASAYKADPTVCHVTTFEPEAAIDRATEIAELYDDLETLTPERRATLLCRYGLEMSIRETTAALDIPQGTVMSQTFRGLRTLRQIAI